MKPAENRFAKMSLSRKTYVLGFKCDSDSRAVRGTAAVKLFLGFRAILRENRGETTEV